MPKVTFEVESEAEPLLIVSRKSGDDSVNEVVDLKPAGAKKRKGSVTSPSGRTNFLTWIFTGNPGTKYKITLTPKSKITLRASDNPIESSIATNRTMTTGSDQFEVAS